MNELARDAMAIIWDGEWHHGMNFYGLRSRTAQPVPDVSAAWSRDYDSKTHLLVGEAWEVPMWEVLVGQWPDQREVDEFVESTLWAIVDSGCLVAWVAFEACFLDPPSLFDPVYMAGCVYAAVDRTNGFRSSIRLDQPIAPLPDIVLDELRLASGGLAESV